MAEKYQPETPLVDADGEPIRLPRIAAMVALLMHSLRTEAGSDWETDRGYHHATKILADALITVEVARRQQQEDVADQIESLLPFPAPVRAWLWTLFENDVHPADYFGFTLDDYPFLGATVKEWATEPFDPPPGTWLPFGGTARRLYELSVVLSEQRAPGEPPY